MILKNPLINVMRILSILHIYKIKQIMCNNLVYLVLSQFGIIKKYLNT